MSNINIVNGELNINSQLTLSVGSGAGYLGAPTYNVALGYNNLQNNTRCYHKSF